jgi:hypothetical protein
MAINPDLPEVQKVHNIEGYLQETLGTAHFQGVPSFLEFLESKRGIPADYFSEENLRLMALNSEMVMYNLYLRQIQANIGQAQSREAHAAELSKMSLEDLKVRAGMMSSELSILESEIEKAAKELATQDVGD